MQQTFKDFEFIIVNDSPRRNKIKKLLHHYGTVDHRIRIIENNKNLGLTKSLNRAIRIANGRYIARMDADDISLPERLCLQYGFLKRNANVFLVGSSVQIIDENGIPKGKVIKHSNHKKIVEDILANRLPFYHPTIMFRNIRFLYRENFETTQDYDFYLNLLSRNKKFSNLKQILFYYRTSDQSVSMTKRRKQIILKRLALRFYHERVTTGKDSYHHLDFNDAEFFGDKTSRA